MSLKPESLSFALKSQNSGLISTSQLEMLLAASRGTSLAPIFLSVASLLGLISMGLAYKYGLENGIIPSIMPTDNVSEPPDTKPKYPPASPWADTPKNPDVQGKPCTLCNGWGKIQYQISEYGKLVMRTENCPRCGGSGIDPGFAL